MRRRLGCILLGLGRALEAEPLLRGAWDRFSVRLGTENPVAGEARLALAVAKAHQLLAFQAHKPWSRTLVVNKGSQVFTPGGM